MQMGMTHMDKDQCTEAAIEKFKPDVLIETKVVR